MLKSWVWATGSKSVACATSRFVVPSATAVATVTNRTVTITIHFRRRIVDNAESLCTRAMVPALADTWPRSAAKVSTSMIDLHSHILPGVDDGAGDLQASLAMARVAVDNGIQTMVATPHLNSRYRVEPNGVSRAVGILNLELAREGIPLAVLSGVEIAFSQLPGVDTAT